MSSSMDFSDTDQGSRGVPEPGLVVQVKDAGHYEDEDRGFFTHLSPVTLGIVCACVAAAILICIVAFFWIKARRRRQKLLHDLTFDDGTEECKSTKSAPASRTSSPKRNKRRSCPEALTISPGLQAVIVRPVTSTGIPDFTLPPERVQPWRPSDRRGEQTQGGGIHRALGGITPDLYHHKSFSEDEGPPLPASSHGRLWYSLLYDVTLEQLQVNLIKVKDLPGRENGSQLRDPFVKMYLLPDERTSRVSKVKKKTLAPLFQEQHTFQVKGEELAKRILRFSVYDVDKRRVRHSLGHVIVPLKSIDLAKGEVMWCDLDPTVHAASSQGEIQISLLYVPANEKIRVTIHRAKNLNHVEEYPDMDAYTRVQLFYGHKCHRVKRTLARPGGSDVTFNESLSFTVNTKQMEACSLVVCLFLASPRLYSSSELELGRVVLGSFMYARGDELAHWQAMTSQPKIATTRWHALTNVSGSP